MGVLGCLDLKGDLSSIHWLSQGIFHRDLKRHLNSRLQDGRRLDSNIEISFDLRSLRDEQAQRAKQQEGEFHVLILRNPFRQYSMMVVRDSPACFPD